MADKALNHAIDALAHSAQADGVIERSTALWLIDEARAALSELARLRAEREWILIATTTEDVPHKPVLLGRAGEKLMAFAIFMGRHWRHADSQEVVCFEPTHYMHLPAPPVQSHEEKQGWP